MFRLAAATLRRAALPAATLALATGASSSSCDGSHSDRTKSIARSVNSYIDHTLLKADATPSEVIKLCEEAAIHQFASVCVNAVFVGLARSTLDALQSPHLRVCAVVGFPLGATSSVVKAFEAETAIGDGADEIDMVLPVGILKAAASGKDNGEAQAYVLRDIAAVVSACHANGAVCKVILETSLLTDAERDLGVRLCAMAGADFVKTSTGFSTGGATVKDVGAMAAVSQQSAASHHGVWCQVKASGGIRTCSDALRMIEAGATRLGCSAGVAIVRECNALADAGGSSEGGATAAAGSSPGAGAY